MGRFTDNKITTKTSNIGKVNLQRVMSFKVIWFISFNI